MIAAHKDQEWPIVIAEHVADSFVRGKRSYVVAGSKAATVLTAAIRKEFSTRDFLTGPEFSFERLKPVMIPKTEASSPAAYKTGFKIEFTESVGAFVKSERVTVRGPAAGNTALKVVGADDGIRVLPLAAVGRFKVYEPEVISLQVGDVIQLTEVRSARLT